MVDFVSKSIIRNEECGDGFMVAGDVDKRAVSNSLDLSVVEDEASERFSGVFVMAELFIVVAVLVGVMK